VPRAYPQSGDKAPSAQGPSVPPPTSPLKKGTGSEPKGEKPVKNNGREVPVSLFFNGLPRQARFPCSSRYFPVGILATVRNDAVSFSNCSHGRK
jgi:hypothetical protein